MKCYGLTILVSILSYVASAAIGPIQKDSIICVGQPTSFTDTTSGGIWSSSNTAVGTIHPSTGAFTAISAGVTTITYTVGSSFVTTTVTISPLPPPITGPSTLCEGATVTFYNTTPGGGYWSVTAYYYLYIDGLNFGNSVSIKGLHVGSEGLYFTDASWCSSSIHPTVIPQPAPISGRSSIYVDSIATLSSSTIGGKWSSSDMAVAAIDSLTGVVYGMSVGTVTITYTTTCTTTRILTVLPPVSVPIQSADRRNEIYPNPATTEITLTAANKITNISISNLIGQTVCSRVCNAEQVQIGVSDLPSGIYFIKINGTEVRKFVKE